MTQTPEHVRACYDRVADAYARTFLDELNHKPFDRAQLEEFARRVRGPAVDLGCGPGQTTAFLHTLGVDVRGIDISPEAIAQAKRHHPGVPFETGNMLALALLDASVDGVNAAYAIVNLSREEAALAFREMARVLRPGGTALVSFHVGDEIVHLDQFLGEAVSIDFTFFRVETVVGWMLDAGFADIDPRIRDPYPGVEHPSRRAYVWAVTPSP